MNGFKILADSYRKAEQEGTMSKGEVENKIRVYDFLATCNDDDICNMFDSGAFNEIAKGYMRIAVKELIEENVIDEEQGQAVKNRYALLFSEKTAKEV